MGDRMDGTNSHFVVLGSKRDGMKKVKCYLINFEIFLKELKVARYSFSGSIPPKFKRKLRRQKQSFGKIVTTVVLDIDENLL